MCIISINDEIMPPTLADKLQASFNRLDLAQCAVLDLALRLDDGDSASDLGGTHADAKVRRVIGEMHAARYEYDAALCSLMTGEPYRPLPTQPAMGLEMQARMHRNGRATVNTGVPATVSPALAG